jgi:CBS domain-containing protein
MTSPDPEDSLQVLTRGEVPSLKALVLHNSTVWRWNRPCYGTTEGRPHLRLEFRALPAGPTVLDEVANATFFFGLMRSVPHEFGNVSARMPFDDVKDNFFAAARHGLKAQVSWFGGKHHAVDKLITEQLLPLAAAGLKDASIDGEDIDRYLGVIRGRIEADQTGSDWILSAGASMPTGTGSEYRDRRIVAAMLMRQKSGEPVHQWNPVAPEELERFGALPETVAEIMSTDLFTIGPDDPITLAASMMDWRRIRHLPVEGAGKFLGLISSREVLRLIADPNHKRAETHPLPVRELMNPEPVTVRPDNSTSDALKLMLENELDCLPVTEGNQLVGLITSRDMLLVLSAVLRFHPIRSSKAPGVDDTYSGRFH